MNQISDDLFRKGAAKLHIFGKGNNDSFRISHLNSKDQKGVKLMFSDKIREAREKGYNDIYALIGYEELYEYVDKKVEEDNNILIGDIIYVAPAYESRPYYGLFIVSYDLKKKCKTYDNHEGMPYIKDINIIKQLKENDVTYDNINKYYSQLPKFEYWEEFKYSWVDHGIYEGIN